MLMNRAIRLILRLPAVAHIMNTNFFLAFVSLFIGIILARSLGPQKRGELAALILWPGLFAQMALLGLPTYLARKAARQPKNAAVAYRQGYKALGATCALAVAIYAAAVLSVGNFPPPNSDRLLALIAGIIIPFSMWNAFQIQMELGRQHFHLYNLGRISFIVSQFFLVVAIWLLSDYGVLHYLLAFEGAAIAACLITHGFIIRTLPAPVENSGTYKRAPIHQLLWAARRFGLSTAINVAAFSGDKVLVSIFFNPEIMGLYVIASTISQIPQLVGDAISQLFFMKVSQNSRLQDVDRAWLALRLRQAVAVYSAVCLLGLIVFPPLVIFVFGRQYSGSIALLYILIPAETIKAMMRPFEELLRSVDKSLEHAKAVVAASMFLAIFGVVAALTGSVMLLALVLLGSATTGLSVIVRVIVRDTGLRPREFLLVNRSDIAEIAHRVRAIARND
jgi:O-antigen/teichoic acid export membrane protein